MSSKRESRFRVLVNEEFGLALWWWYPAMCPADLVRWFRGVEASRALIPASLPGEVAPFSGTQEEFQEAFGGSSVWSAHVHTLDDSYLRSPEGEVTRSLFDWDALELHFEQFVSLGSALLSETHEALQAAKDAEEAALVLQRADDDSRLAFLRFVEAEQRSLDLSFHQLGMGLSAALGASRYIAHLTSLDLSGNALGREAGRMLASPGDRSKGVSACVLILKSNGIDDVGAQAFIEAELTLLDLRENPVHDSAVHEALVGANIPVLVDPLPPNPK